MNAELLRVSDLSVLYGRALAVHDVSLDVRPRECVALYGPNGHGKSTILAAIAGLLKPASGSVLFQGSPIRYGRPTATHRRGLTYIPQGSILFPRLSVQDCLALAVHRSPNRAETQKRLRRVVDLFPKLHERTHQVSGTLSGGERQMLAIAIGLLTDPDLLILDEPTLGIAPVVRGEILTALRELRASGLSIIVADGDIDFLYAVCDRWNHVSNGTIAARGDSSERPDHDTIMQMFSGARG